MVNLDRSVKKTGGEREEEGGYFERVSENGKRGCGEFGRKVQASGTLGAWAEVAGGDWRCDMPGSWALF